MNALRLIVACLCWCAVARGESLVIATYNIENYNATDRMTPDGFKKDYPKPEAQKTALRGVIHALHADILVLQEMGPRPYLDELQRDLAKQGDDYPNAFLVEGPDPERHVALLAKRPWKSVMPHPEVEFSYFHGHEKAKRGVLEVTFATAGGDVTLWAVHLKSRFTERDDDPTSARWRAGEATAIRQIILKEFPRPASDQFIILGDFNDGRESKPLQSLMRRGETEIATVLPAADSHGEVWTEFYAREEVYSGFDHVLVSPGLMGAVRDGRAKIFDAPQTAAASDHRPVVVTLDFPPAAEKK